MKDIIAYEGMGSIALGLMIEEYVPIYIPWINERSSIRGTTQRPPYSAVMGVEWVRGLDNKRGKEEVFAVLIKQKTKKPMYRYVGHIGVHGIVWPHGFGTVGTMIGDKSAQGVGCGTEAMLLMLYHAFMILGLRKLTTMVKAYNAPSMGHLLKCGYQSVGRFKRHHLHEGGFVDEVLFEVFRDEWEQVWRKYQETSLPPRLSNEQKQLVMDYVSM